MLNIIIWIVIIALFLGSFIGLLFPIIPSSLLIWIGFLLYHFALHAGSLGTLFWISMVLLTVILIIADMIANSFFVKRFGGTKWGERAAAIGVIIGSFVIPPFGILVVPFVMVILIELFQKRTAMEAMKAAIGSLIGFLGGIVAKIVIQLIMIIWFFIAVIF